MTLYRITFPVLSADGLHSLVIQHEGDFDQLNTSMRLGRPMVVKYENGDELLVNFAFVLSVQEVKDEA